MTERVERAYFVVCLAVGWLLRTTRYSSTSFVDHDGQQRVLKQRRFYAPVLIWMGVPLARILDTGVRVITQREWEERERRLYETLYDASVEVDADGTIVLPRLPGKTLASLLEDTELAPLTRNRAITCAVTALAGLHRLGVTHGDAMAENVLVDINAGLARWFDFETVHDPHRPMTWRRADDMRALLMTCVARTAPARVRQTVGVILGAYRDEDVTRFLAAEFASILRRPLAFHLGQARLSVGYFREIGRLLNSGLDLAIADVRSLEESPKSHPPLTR